MKNLNLLRRECYFEKVNEEYSVNEYYEFGNKLLRVHIATGKYSNKSSLVVYFFSLEQGWLTFLIARLGLSCEYLQREVRVGNSVAGINLPDEKIYSILIDDIRFYLSSCENILEKIKNA